MSTAGWIMISLSWSMIIILVVFCYKRILIGRRSNIKAILEINTEND